MVQQSVDELLSNIRDYILPFGIALIIYQFFPIIAPKVIPAGIVGLIVSMAYLLVVILGWLLFYKGSSVISLMFEGKQRFWFQLRIALITPVILSAYFIDDVEGFYLAELFAHYSWFSIISFGFVFYIGWHLINFEDYYGFFIRKCLGTSLVLFLICWQGHLGYYTESDDYSEGSSLYLDKEKAKQYALSGQYMMHYLGLVMSAYLGIYLGIRNKKKDQISS